MAESEAAVRRGGESDLPALRDLWIRLAQHHSATMPGLVFRAGHPEVWGRWLELRLKDGQTIALIAEAGGRPAGYLLASVTESLPLFPPGKIGYVDEAYVIPDFRGRGLFKRLLEQALAWMREQGAGRVEADVYADNDIGLRAWGNNGFSYRSIRVARDL